MARTPLPPGEAKENFNAKLDPAIIQRIKVLCFRRSIAQGKKFSEGKFVTNAALSAPMPRPPTQAQIDAYIAKHPHMKDKVLELAALTIPKIPV